jgi:hypothetical protein
MLNTLLLKTFDSGCILGALQGGGMKRQNRIVPGVLKSTHVESGSTYAETWLDKGKVLLF